MAYIGNSPDLNESVDTAQLKSPLTGDLGLGADADGTDRILTFGHSTLKSVIGIDDSADIFAINTDDAFEAANDLEIDASGNVTISNGTLTINADDTGADVRFYSATTNEGLLYDASEDELGLLLTTKLKFHDIGGGEEIYASGDGALVMNSGTSLTVTTPDYTLTSATASKPVFHIKNTAVDATSSELKFDNPRGGGAGSAGDDLGRITFYGQDDASNNQQFGEILSESAGVGNGSEEGKMSFYVASPTMARGLLLSGSSTSAEVDVTIGGGAASVATVAGHCTVTGTLNVDQIEKDPGNLDIIAEESGSTLNLRSNVGVSLSATTGGNYNVVFNADNLYPETSNVVDLGHASYLWEEVFSGNGSINTSDERKKDDIADSSLGLAFLNQLRPVQYTWKDYTMPEILYKEGDADIPKSKEVGDVKNEERERTFIRTHYGLIAQEVEQVLEDNGMTTTDFAPFIKTPVLDGDGIDGEPTGDHTYGMRYTEYVGILIKAIQELTAKVEALENA